MKILVISSILPIPGAISFNDFVFHTYTNYLQQYKNDEVVIINPVKYDLNIRTFLRKQTRLQKLKSQLQWEIRGFQVEIFPFFSAWSARNLHALVSRTVYFVNRKRIKALFDSYDFDIIHARFIFADGFLAYLLSKKYHIPYVISTHNERFYFEHFYSRRVAFRILKSASYVLPLNYSNLEYFQANGIINLKQSTHGFYNTFLRDQREDANEQISILSVCELIRLKNIDKVIEALKSLKEKYNFRYTIIGKGPEKESLKEQVNSAGMQDHIIFIDYVPHDQIADEMYKHEVFIMPSYFETFGRVYFEVMAMGIPIICARNSGIYGLFKEGEEGLAVDHKSVENISSALAFLMDKPEERRRIGSNGQKLVSNYTWENIAKDLHNIYTSSIRSFGNNNESHDD